MAPVAWLDLVGYLLHSYVMMMMMMMMVMMMMGCAPRNQYFSLSL
jgi:hypothetical protein